MRSLLFVPGNTPRMLEKALGFRPDAYVPDLEDSVPDSEKANARRVTTAHLSELAARGIPVIPRVNALDTGWTEEDLAAVVGPSILGISIGKIDTVEDIESVSSLMARLESKAGLGVGTLKLIPWIETALAIVHCFEICRASPRIVAVAFGGEDFSHDMGIERTDSETALLYARSAVCVAARAAGVQALDTPYFRFKDEEGLKANVQAAKRLGFKGKFAIHPAQVEPLNLLFSPSAQDIAQAHRIVGAFEEAEREGRGSTSLDGRVIDVPVVKRARAVLAQAESTARPKSDKA